MVAACVEPLTLYRPRDPQASDLWRLLDQHFDCFQQVYDERFAAKYGFWRPVVDRSVQAFLKCGDLHQGFARVRCPDCHHEMFVAFSCKQRCTCPSCHQKPAVGPGQDANGQQKSLVARLIRDFSSPTGCKGAWDSNHAHDEVLGMLAAGRDTTAAALAWTLYFIAANPAVQRCAREEAVASIGQARRALLELPELRYTEMVIQEALRICPPNWLLVVREAVEDTTLGGVSMPSGSRVYVSPYIIQRDSRWFQDPERFDPERFTDEQAARIRRFSFLPFGAGPRACVGKAWVQVILKAVLNTLLESFELKLPGKALDVESEAALVVKPKGPLHLDVWTRGRFARGD